MAEYGCNRVAIATAADADDDIAIAEEVREYERAVVPRDSQRCFVSRLR